MSRLRDCLDGLADVERDVLALRAGVGPDQPYSRAVVARRLELSTDRVRHVERRALPRLRRLGRQGCSDGGSTTAGATSGSILVPNAFGVPVKVPLAVFSGRGSDGSGAEGNARNGRDRSGVKGERADSAPPDGPPGGLLVPQSRAVSLIFPLLLLALATAAIVAYRYRRERQRRSAYY